MYVQDCLVAQKVSPEIREKFLSNIEDPTYVTTRGPGARKLGKLKKGWKAAAKDPSGQKSKKKDLPIKREIEKKRTFWIQAKLHK